MISFCGEWQSRGIYRYVNGFLASSKRTPSNKHARLSFLRNPLYALKCTSNNYFGMNDLLLWRVAESRNYHGKNIASSRRKGVCDSFTFHVA